MRTLQIPRSARNFIEGLGPYHSLLLLAVPLAIVEPLKLIAVFVLGEGHFVTGVMVMICAYAGSLFITERLFHYRKAEAVDVVLVRTALDVVYRNSRFRTPRPTASVDASC